MIAEIKKQIRDYERDLADIKKRYDEAVRSGQPYVADELNQEIYEMIFDESERLRNVRDIVIKNLSSKVLNPKVVEAFSGLKATLDEFIEENTAELNSFVA